MAKEVQQGTLDMMDEILKTEDPAFMESLKELSPEKLNTGPISVNPTKEEIRASRRTFKKMIQELSRKQRLLIVYTGFICFVAAPLLFFSMKGAFTPKFGVTEVASMADYADEIIPLDALARDKDLMKIFRFEEFIFDLKVHTINLKPKDKIRFGRFGFSIEVKHKENMELLKKREMEILDVLSGEIGRVNYEAFSGMPGKRKMRRILVKALRAKISPDIFNIYYNLVVFNN